MTTPRQQEARAADRVDAFTAFAPRLDGHGFVCERQPHPGKTVRYQVTATDDGAVLGHIAWEGHRKEYVFAATQPMVCAPRWLAEMKEILVYLTARQRRRTTGRAR